MGATPAITVSGAAAETTKKEMSAVVRVPVLSPGAPGGVSEVLEDMAGEALPRQVQAGTRAKT